MSVEPQTWTFGTSGWLFIYFFGVIKAMRELDCDRDVYAIGSSGGALAAGTLFVPECDMDEMAKFIGECCDDCRRSFWNRFKVREYVKQALEKFCPPDIADKVRGRLEVSVTQLSRIRNIRWRNFEHKDEYVDAILASSCAVGIAGLPYRTRKYGLLVDGGFSDLDLVAAMLLGRKFCSFHNEHASVSVCPFYWSRADIRPSQFINPIWALFPPPKEQLLQLYGMGYNDAMQFLCHKLSLDQLPSGSPMGSPGWHSSPAPSVSSSSLCPESAAGTGADVASGGHDPAEDAILQQLQEEASCAQMQMQQSLLQAKDRMTSLSSVGLLARSVLRATAWQLIYGEVVLLTYITALLFWAIPFLRATERQKHWKRACSCWGGLVNARLLLKMMPILGCSISIQEDPHFVLSLQDLSFMYRLFKYHL